MIRLRTLRRSVVFYAGLFITLFFVTDMLLFQYPTSRRSNYIQARNNVLEVVGRISNMEESVLPNQSTVILEPSPGLTCQDSGNGLFVLFIVISAPDNVQRRELIRSTFQEMTPRWVEQYTLFKQGNDAPELADITRVFQLLFFVGQSAEHGMSNDVRDEWERHGDVIVDDLQESYLKLTVKTLRMLKWVLHNCPFAKYIVKMDDDVFLNVPWLFSYLLRKTPHGYNSLLIAGHVYNEVAPDRDFTSKWFTPRSMWPAEHLPKFVAGFCYVLGLKAAQDLFDASKNIRLFHLEDVFLTGIVASESLNYELTDPDGIVVMLMWYHSYNPVNWPMRKLIIHDVTPKQFRCWTRNTGYLPQKSWIQSYWPLFLSCWW